MYASRTVVIAQMCPLTCADTQNVLKRVALTILTTDLPYNPICGQQYEAPYMKDKTNKPPAPMSMNLTALVSGLTPGEKYNLYQYRFADRPLIGPLDVPTSDFNANAKKAFSNIPFTAAGTTYQTTISITSAVTVTFRCVPITAP